MKKILAMLLLAGAMFAQDAKPPVEIVQVKTNRDKYVVTIKYKNVSDKKIVGTKFAVEYIDDVGDSRPAATTFASDDKLNPGDTKFNAWDSYLFIQKKATARVLKVRFEDGTIWEVPEPKS